MHRRPSTLISLAATLAAALVLSACGGGTSDTVGSGDSAAADAKTKLDLIAYSVPKAGFDVLIPAFGKTPEGAGVGFSQSYGASGDQSRKVVGGAPADIVNFSVTPDMTRLVKAGLVDKDWDAGTYGGIAFGSVVTFLVRPGNPLKIKGWDDLLKPGVEVVSPNPASSGSAKWNLLAPYAASSNGGKDPAAGLAYVKNLITDHVKIRPKSGREATEAFLQGQGDVLLSYENEALFDKRSGEKVDIVNPAVTFKIENPIAVVNTTKSPKQAKAFVDYLYTPAAQRLWAKAGFRPVVPSVIAETKGDFATGQKIWTIDDLGGWAKIDPQLFDPDNGAISKIYDNATG